MKLEGKNAIVTGGGRGVGRAISLAFAQEGANVVINYAGNQKAADEVVEMIKGMGRKAVAVKGDVGQEADAQKIVETCAEAFGSVHIIINNAGISKPSMMHKMSVETWDEVVNVQMRGPWLMAKAASKYFMQQNYGRIVNVTSVAGVVGTIGQINYSAAKGGVISMTKSMARELAKFNVTANVVSLGIVTTEMTHTIRRTRSSKRSTRSVSFSDGTRTRKMSHRPSYFLLPMTPATSRASCCAWMAVTE